MAGLDEMCGKTEPPELYAPDIPDFCPWCDAELDELDGFGCCPECGGEIEP